MAIDQLLVDQLVDQRAQRLIRLEGQSRQDVSGRPGVAVDGSQRVPLGKRRSDRRHSGIDSQVVTVLHALDGSSEVLQSDLHATKSPYIR